MSTNSQLDGLVGGFVPFRGTRGHSYTLAHRGVLVLDEVNEFRRDVLEGLRRGTQK